MDVNLELRIDSFKNKALPLIQDALPLEDQSSWNQQIDVSTSDTDDYRWSIDDAIAAKLPPEVLQQVDGLFSHELGFSR